MLCVPLVCARQVILHSRVSKRRCVVGLCVRACVEHRNAPLKFVCCSVGRMFWPATHVHARAEHVPPPHGTLALSTVRGPRGVLVPSQTGGATQGVSRRAFLAGQDLVAERSSFVTQQPRSYCRKLSGVLTVRVNAGVETRLVLRSFPSVSRQQRVLHPMCL